jgi:hypothetical protein
VDESAVSDSKTLTVLPFSFVDNTIPVTIGTHEYRTKIYNGLTWMVENSMEGTPSATYYDDCTSCLNYYYSYATATAAQSPACPDPWRLPTAEEVLSFQTYLYGSNSDNADTYYWRHGARFTGTRIDGLWSAWGLCGDYFAAGGYRWRIWADGGTPADALTLTRLCSIRCVRDLD